MCVNILHKNVPVNDITVLSVGHKFNMESMAKGRLKRCDILANVLDNSSSLPKKANILFRGMFN